MPTDFEDRVTEVTQQLLTTVNEQSLEFESRNRHTNVLMAELDTQMHELLAAACTLAATSRNCTFDIGVRTDQPDGK
ncbi:hypothetical protein IW147_003083 [Coemansia sp. RSA 720]|nr:hypothetical protein IW147_003083 [Coemansia sp. RSA 720]